MENTRRHETDQERQLREGLINDIAAGIRVLKTRDGVNLSEDQIMDRARNIATALIYNDYFDGILPWESKRPAPDFQSELIK